MTEAEWLAAEFFPPMLDQIRGEGPFTRKYLLLGVALCRRIWSRFPFDECKRMIEAVERLADHPQVEGDDVPFPVYAEINSKFEELQLGYPRVAETNTQTRGAYLAAMACGGMFHDPVRDIESVADSAAFSVGRHLGLKWDAERQAQARLLKELFGNPFRPVVFNPRWRSETAVALASSIYAERAFDRMPILADALEEAGCDHPHILNHCREPGPHARGCWVVDAVLEKE